MYSLLMIVPVYYINTHSVCLKVGHAKTRMGEEKNEAIHLLLITTLSPQRAPLYIYTVL